MRKSERWQSNIENLHHPGGFQTTNEDAEDIASKLWNKTIKINPSFWLGKDIKNYETQINNQIVKQGLLTQDEVQYVSWSDLKINLAGWFWNKGAFTVKKDGATMTGHVTIDADSGEAPQQIARKITEATNIKFNLNYWNTKSVQDYLPQLRDILVNDQILTKIEASVISGVSKPITIKEAGQITFNIKLDNGKTTSSATSHVDVLNDGSSAVQIANSINGSGFGLKVNTAGMYADSSYVIRNFSNLLESNYGHSATDIDHIILPHVKLKPENPNLQAKVLKDGQLVTANIQLECRTGPYIYYYIVENGYMQAYVNLNGTVLANLKKWFLNKPPYFSHHLNEDIKCFYQMLDDNQDGWLDSFDYPGSYSIPWSNRLDENMGSFGNAGDTATKIIEYESDALDNSTVKSFAQQLYNEVINSNNYLSLMFEWHYYKTVSAANYITEKYKFW